MTTNANAGPASPFHAAAAAAFPAQFIELMTRSTQISPAAWRKSCDLLATAAEDHAKMLHELANADSPVAATAILAQYWQDAARKGINSQIGSLLG